MQTTVTVNSPPRDARMEDTLRDRLYETTNENSELRRKIAELESEKRSMKAQQQQQQQASTRFESTRPISATAGSQYSSPMNQTMGRTAGGSPMAATITTSRRGQSQTIYAEPGQTQTIYQAPGETTEILVPEGSDVTTTIDCPSSQTITAEVISPGSRVYASISGANVVAEIESPGYSRSRNAGPSLPPPMGYSNFRSNNDLGFNSPKPASVYEDDVASTMASPSQAVAPHYGGTTSYGNAFAPAEGAVVTSPMCCISSCPTRCERIEWTIHGARSKLLNSRYGEAIRSPAFKCSRLNIPRIEFDFYPRGDKGSQLNAGSIVMRSTKGMNLNFQLFVGNKRSPTICHTFAGWAVGGYRHDFTFLSSEVGVDDTIVVGVDVFSSCDNGFHRYA